MERPGVGPRRFHRGRSTSLSDNDSQPHRRIFRRRRLPRLPWLSGIRQMVTSGIGPFPRPNAPYLQRMLGLISEHPSSSPQRPDSTGDLGTVLPSPQTSAGGGNAVSRAGWRVQMSSVFGWSCLRVLVSCSGRATPMQPGLATTPPRQGKPIARRGIPMRRRTMRVEASAVPPDCRGRASDRPTGDL